MRLLAAGLATPGVADAAPAVPPVRREPTVTARVENWIETLEPELQEPMFALVVSLVGFGIAPGQVDPSDADFFAADLVVPRATTAELATFSRRAGRRAAVRWFCDAYATPPAGTPEAVSLQSIVQVAVDRRGQLGALAANALVCPEPECRVSDVRRFSFHFHLPRHLFDWIDDLFEQVDGVTGRVVSTSSSLVPPAAAASFDAAACERLFLRTPRRGRALVRATRDAAESGGCLRVRAAEPSHLIGRTPFVSVDGVASEACE